MNKILLCDYVKLKTQECQNTAARCSCFYKTPAFWVIEFLTCWNSRRKSQIHVGLGSFFCGLYTAHRSEASSLGTKVNLKKLTGIQKRLSLHFAETRTEDFGWFHQLDNTGRQAGGAVSDISVMGGVKSEATGSSGSPSPAPPTLEQPHGSFLKGCWLGNTETGSVCPM